MNQRIKVLIEQATTRIDPIAHDGACWDFDKEKFAELIVKECMKICQNHPSIIFKNEWDADVVATDIVSRLESHFGVAE